MNPDISYFPQVDSDAQPYLGVQARYTHTSRIALLVQQLARDAGYLGPDEEVVHIVVSTAPGTYQTWDEKEEAKRLSVLNIRAIEATQKTQMDNAMVEWVSLPPEEKKNTTKPRKFRGFTNLYNKRDAPKYIADRTP